MIAMNSTFDLDLDEQTIFLSGGKYVWSIVHEGAFVFDLILLPY